MALTANSLVKATGAAAIADTDLSGAVTTSGSSVTTLASGLSPNFAAISLAGQKLQSFVVEVINSAGTIQHRIIGSVTNAEAAAYADKITGASSTLANTPTVGAGTDFTSGAGIVGNIIVLNTADQDAATFFGHVEVEYYDGNVVHPRAYIGFTSRDVNGTTRDRLEIGLTNAMTAGAWTINTTQLPAGKAIYVRFTGFLT